MRYGIFSDIHSNLEAFQAVIAAYQKESIDQYLCIGDVVGYAANPLECIDELGHFVEESVAGNHDWASVDLFISEYFNPAAKKAIEWTRLRLDNKGRYFLKTLKLVYQNKDLTLVHGTLKDPQDFDYMTDGYTALETFKLLKTELCFVGHSHVAGVFSLDKDDKLNYSQPYHVKIKGNYKYIINVGSVGQPRDGDPRASYCIYDADKKDIKIKRIDYDIKSAARKIITSGLPQFLAQRLYSGR
ncbi:MAG: metallophosphoesterase family protein [Candidatus Omnitrophota bacterium]